MFLQSFKWLALARVTCIHISAARTSNAVGRVSLGKDCFKSQMRWAGITNTFVKLSVAAGSIFSYTYGPSVMTSAIGRVGKPGIAVSTRNRSKDWSGIGLLKPASENYSLSAWSVHALAIVYLAK